MNHRDDADAYFYQDVNPNLKPDPSHYLKVGGPQDIIDLSAVPVHDLMREINRSQNWRFSGQIEDGRPVLICKYDGDNSVLTEIRERVGGWWKTTWVLPRPQFRFVGCIR